MSEVVVLGEHLDVAHRHVRRGGRRAIQMILEGPPVRSAPVLGPGLVVDREHGRIPDAPAAQHLLVASPYRVVALPVLGHESLQCWSGIKHWPIERPKDSWCFEE